MDMFKVISLLSLVAWIDSKAADSKAVGYIVGGDYSDANNYPHLVHVAADGMVCGGCLIAKNAVLTAAHCSTNTDPNAYDIRQGKTTQQEMQSAERLKAISVHVHQDYNKKKFGADITVILIDPNHSLTNFLKLEKGTVAEGTPAVLAGWGKENPAGEVSSQLKALDFKVTSESACKQLNFEFDSESHLCGASVEQGGSSCMGDSGGPLVKDKTTIVGIVSYGSSVCNAATGFTRISTYASWVEGILRNNSTTKEAPDAQANSGNQTQPTTSEPKEDSKGTNGQPGMPNYPPQPIQSPAAQPDQYTPQTPSLSEPSMNQPEQDVPFANYQENQYLQTNYLY